MLLVDGLVLAEGPDGRSVRMEGSGETLNLHLQGEFGPGGLSRVLMVWRNRSNLGRFFRLARGSGLTVRVYARDRVVLEAGPQTSGNFLGRFLGERVAVYPWR